VRKHDFWVDDVPGNLCISMQNLSEHGYIMHPAAGAEGRYGSSIRWNVVTPVQTTFSPDSPGVPAFYIK
jgi:hypothetical protein